MRPQSLREVIDRASPDDAAFADACHDFLDAFYLRHGDREAPEVMLRAPLELTGDAFQDACIGAMGEHLARRWNLPVPEWTGGRSRNRLGPPVFVPESKALRGYLLSASPPARQPASPPAFRARLVFTGSDPLQRARFPRDGDESKVALAWPARVFPNRGIDARDSVFGISRRVSSP
ncbi:hypothetical protein ACFZ8E_03990 [Methylobacterium sp. HMF5984]|uniref:hypothetical protein n=1 Tax=Methylobacterium sp. HMF5984 TaxID=3367370 RepID=UPI00385545BB